MTNHKSPFVTLNNGVAMPQLGLGVWQTRDGDEVEEAVSAALEAGYRLIDTAAVYGNETGVGNAIRASGIPREEIFVTTKLWNSDQDRDKVRGAFETSLKKLGFDYVDLYLIHWPMPAKGLYVETWQIFEELYKEGTARAIGVSNFQIPHLEVLAQHSSITPAVNQIELHPFFPEHELREYGKTHGIQIESWSPLGSKGDLLGNKKLAAVAKVHNKSSAQVVIRWHLQHDLVVIPKSVHAERIKENIDVFDFELSEEEMAIIDSLETGKRLGPDPNTLNSS
ncbi:MAG: glyoxal reductase [Candidatus Saccharibacteria bacterium]|nr:glyoxal reductase [Candidatus Saccharibacteria bacterium]